LHLGGVSRAAGPDRNSKDIADEAAQKGNEALKQSC
jgi:hypothetical protein